MEQKKNDQAASVSSGAFGNINPNNLVQQQKNRDSINEYLLQRQESMFSRLFPDQVTKSAMKARTKMVEQYGKQAINTQRIIGEYEQKALTTALNGVLLQGIGHVASQSKLKYDYYFVQLSKGLNDQEERFFKIVEEKRERAKRATHERLKERIEQSIIKEIDHYYDMKEQFISEFKDKIDSLIQT